MIRDLTVALARVVNCHFPAFFSFYSFFLREKSYSLLEKDFFLKNMIFDYLVFIVVVVVIILE